jgi:hypothetical protein
LRAPVSEDDGTIIAEQVKNDLKLGGLIPFITSDYLNKSELI